jgi:hypothetical protein
VEAWQVLGAIGVLAVLGLVKTRAKPAPSKSQRPPTRREKYPGDFTGTVRFEYAPNPNGAPNPGEVVWTWVPFEEDHTKGKDRPVLLMGRDGTWLVGLMLTSKDHDGRPAGRERWMDIGAGDWDRQRRPSEVRLDRIVRIDPRTVRREGATVPRSTFDAVSRSLSDLHNW